MPITTLTRVDTVDCVEGFYIVRGFDAKKMPWKFTTNKAWAAAAADRALVKNLPLIVEWRDSRHFGKDIVSAGIDA